jgi:5-methyltetrahydropteroyltriglutamate--homocysteine methyltransferase
VDNYYRDFETLTMGIAQVLAAQLADLDCDCVQVDEANITGNPSDSDLAARAINLLLDRVATQKAVHLCFGNYGGQTIQQGEWRSLIQFLNSLHVNHLVLELACRPEEDLDALKDVDASIKLGIGVVEVKINHIETPDEVAWRIDLAEKRLGPDRIAWVHPDCGFWMLKRSVADRKMAALVAGRNKYLGI